MFPVEFNPNAARHIDNIEVESQLGGEIKVDKANQTRDIDDRDPHYCFLERAASRNRPSPIATSAPIVCVFSLHVEKLNNVGFYLTRTQWRQPKQGQPAESRGYGDILPDDLNYEFPLGQGVV
jgi:hypothetical protein